MIAFLRIPAPDVRSAASPATEGSAAELIITLCWAAMAPSSGKHRQESKSPFWKLPDLTQRRRDTEVRRGNTTTKQGFSLRFSLRLCVKIANLQTDST